MHAAGGSWRGIGRHGGRDGHAPLDAEDQLLATVLQCSLVTAGTDARRLHGKNAKALRLAIEQSEHKTTTEAEANAKAMRVAKAQERVVRRMTDISSSPNDS